MAASVLALATHDRVPATDKLLGSAPNGGKGMVGRGFQRRALITHEVNDYHP